MEFCETSLLKSCYANLDLELLDQKEIREKVKAATKLVENIVQLDFDEENVTKFVVDYINLTYKFAYRLHVLCFEKASLEIQYPRINFIDMNCGDENDSNSGGVKKIRENLHVIDCQQRNFLNGDVKDGRIPLFSLSLKKVQNFKKSNVKLINSIEWQRNKKYDTLLFEGHEHIYKKQYEQALEIFNKAFNYKETAEVLTLIGWVYSFLDDIEQAKSYCLEAIKKDSDYGPPYNDFGSYLLSEGNVTEALKWFKMAKDAKVYQNREFPYINSGRAYMAQNNFQEALVLAPYHEELRQTVEKLSSSVEGDPSTFDNPLS